MLGFPVFESISTPKNRLFFLPLRARLLCPGWNICSCVKLFIRVKFSDPVFASAQVPAALPESPQGLDQS